MRSFLYRCLNFILLQKLVGSGHKFGCNPTTLEGQKRSFSLNFKCWGPVDKIDCFFWLLPVPNIFFWPQKPNIDRYQKSRASFSGLPWCRCIDLITFWPIHFDKEKAAKTLNFHGGSEITEDKQQQRIQQQHRNGGKRGMEANKNSNKLKAIQATLRWIICQWCESIFIDFHHFGQ